MKRISNFINKGNEERIRREEKRELKKISSCRKVVSKNIEKII